MSRYDAPTITAIHEALDDEYKAPTPTYAAIIERHGAVRPFVNIIDLRRPPRPRLGTSAQQPRPAHSRR